MSRIEQALIRAGVRRPAEPDAAPPDFAAPQPTLEPDAPRKDAAPSEVREKPVPAIASAPAGSCLVTGSHGSAALEQYRRLAAALHQHQEERRIKVVLVTSALPGEGKTLTAANLALTFSRSYQRRVLLIDGDLRRPAVHKLFGVANSAGLAEALKDGRDALTVLQMAPQLCLLPAGLPHPEPLSALVSERMRVVLDRAAEAFDWVYIDSPPMAVLPDANLLGRMVDAVLLIVRAGVAPHRAVVKAVETLGRDRIVGVVLNGVDPSTLARHYGYPQYDGHERYAGKPPSMR